MRWLSGNAQKVTGSELCLLKHTHYNRLRQDKGKKTIVPAFEQQAIASVESE